MVANWKFSPRSQHLFDHGVLVRLAARHTPHQVGDHVQNKSVAVAASTTLKGFWSRQAVKTLYGVPV